MRRALLGLGPALGLIALQLAAWRLMAELDVVHALLSPGPHSKLAHLLLGVAFLTLRVAAVVGVPGWISAWIVLGFKS